MELDAMLCRTGEIVVCHDERLHRLAGLDWEIAETPWWKLQRADVGTRLGFGPARIPLLESVIEALPSHFLINIELKCTRVDDRGLSERVVECVRAARVEGRAVISSFNFLCMVRAGQCGPGLRLGLLVDPERNYFFQSAVLAPIVATHSIHLPFELCTSERVGIWRERGLEVAAWTVDEPEVATGLQAMGVKYCITNRPAVLRQALESR